MKPGYRADSVPSTVGRDHSTFTGEPVTMESEHLPRRGFVGRFLAAGATFGFAATPALAAETNSPPDEAWLRRLTGRHRQVVDTPSLQQGKALQQTKNFLDAYREAYGLRDADLSAVIVVHGTALPLVFADATWERFDLGRRYAIQDPGTRAPATRNVFSEGRPGDLISADASVRTLKQRGVVFVLCNNTLKRATGEIARSLNSTPEAVRQELLRGLIPGVTVVPAAVIALNRTQERGFTYVYSG